MTAHRIALFVVYRLVALVAALFVVVSGSFLLVGAIPSNPGAAILGGGATKVAVQATNRKLGLDQPLFVRYVDYMRDLLHGDLGHSYYGSDSITSDIRRYLPSTLELIVPAVVLAVLLGVFLGGVGAYFPRRWPDRVSGGVTAAMQSIPDWVFGLVLIFFFYFLLRWAPAPVGQTTVTAGQIPQITGVAPLDALLVGNLPAALSAAAHGVLPVLSLGVVYAAAYSKVARASLGHEMRSPHIEYARACGLPEWRVLQYAWLAGRTPIVTYVAIMTGALVGGEAILETVFSWNGFGQWALTGVLRLDLPVVEAFVLVAGTVTVLVYLALDVVVMLLDPRVRA